MTIKMCVAGADGRMGSTLLKEAAQWQDIEVVGVLTAEESPNRGRPLKDLSLSPPDLVLEGPSRLDKATADAEIFISFTQPSAEMVNIPKIVRLDKKIIIGTTGFSEEQRRELEEIIDTHVPGIIAPNFSIGINLLYKILEVAKHFPPGYDFSVLEIHHTGKADAPSGTANRIGALLKELRGYSQSTYGRSGLSKRGKDELEILSARVGGVPGIHDVIIAGQHEMMRIEHTAFSRSVFAVGALLAVRWLSKKMAPGIYTMNDVLFNQP